MGAPEASSGNGPASSPGSLKGWLDRLRARTASNLPQSGTVLRVLTSTQNCSALVFSIFLGVHLASPVLASVGGLSAADNTLLVGRAYYLPSETLTIYLPLALHLSSSIAKRLILYAKTRRRPPITPHLITGWLLPPIVVGHMASHRLLPSQAAPPISSLSPGEFGMEFAGWSINSQPVRSYVFYLGLVGIATWHAGVGMMKIVSWLKRGRRGGKKGAVGSVDTVQPVQPVQPAPGAPDTADAAGQDVSPTATSQDRAAERPKAKARVNGDGVVISKKRRFGLRGIMLVFLGVVGIGLARIAKESENVSPLMVVRYRAIYDKLESGRWF